MVYGNCEEKFMLVHSWSERDKRIKRSTIFSYVYTYLPSSIVSLTKSGKTDLKKALPWNFFTRLVTVCDIFLWALEQILSTMDKICIVIGVVYSALGSSRIYSHNAVHLKMAWHKISKSCHKIGIKSLNKLIKNLWCLLNSLSPKIWLLIWEFSLPNWVQFGLNNWVQVNFSKTINLLSAPKLASAICSLYKNLHEKSFFYLSMMYMTKHCIRKVRQT